MCENFCVKKRGKESGKVLGTRPPLERMLQIHRAIQSGNYPNATELAQELEVSTKSIYRDIEFMRDRLELPIEFDFKRNGYFYAQEVSSFPTVQITEGELFALLVAEKALQQYRGTSFEKPLISAFRKISTSLPETVSVHLDDWEQTISFRLSAEPVISLEIFQKLASATAAKKQLRILYKKPGVSTAEERIIEPYHLANINGEWFLFAFDRKRNDIRTFVPSRIKSIEETGVVFVRPKKFSLQKRLHDSFGVYSGEKQYQIVIRFSEYAADYVREKKWHESQQLIELPDGGIELRMTLSSLVEIKRWILSWGGHAVAIEPPELAEGILSSAKTIIENQSSVLREKDNKISNNR